MKKIRVFLSKGVSPLLAKELLSGHVTRGAGDGAARITSGAAIENIGVRPKLVEKALGPRGESSGRKVLVCGQLDVVDIAFGKVKDLLQISWRQ